jgi:acetolactate synthase-1/2/3 large subunit
MSGHTPPARDDSMPAAASPSDIPAGVRGADALVAALQAAGVSRVFTLSGNHIMPVYDALVGSGIELVHTRHEAAAVHMADAWSRITGEVGVALVTGGPGHANAVAALYTALMAEAPVVLLSGHAPLGQLGQGAFQEMRQAEMAAPACKMAWTCAGPQEVANDLARAVRIARSGRPGPVHLSLPSDALEPRLSRAATLPAEAFGPVEQALLPAQAQAALDFLAGAQRPLVLAGPACLTRTGRQALHALQNACGVPVVGMESPRGIADPALGAFPQVLARCDAVLLLGKRADFTLGFLSPPRVAAETRFWQIDPEAAEIARTETAVARRLQGRAVADTKSALEALTALASGMGMASACEAAQGDWRQEVAHALAFRPPAWDEATASTPDRLHPVQALRPLQALLDRHPDAVFVCDGGEIGQWAQACLRAPHRVVNGVAGSIGSSLPYALAARLAVPPEAPVLAVMGDGTVGFHIAEFDTAVRCGAAFVAVVGNDARWNAEYQIQLREYGAARAIGCELAPTRYDQVAAAFGAHGELVDSPQALPGAVQRALDSGRPACINVMIEGLAAPSVKAPNL